MHSAHIHPHHSLSDFARKLIVALLLLAVAYLCWRGIHVLLLTFVGILFAVFLSAISAWVEQRTGIRYRTALVLVVLALVAAVGGLCFLFANVVAQQTMQLLDKLPEALQKVNETLQRDPIGQMVLERMPEVAQTLATSPDSWHVTFVLSTLLSAVVAAIVILFVGIFGAAEPQVYRRGLLHLVPPESRQRVSQALDATLVNLHGFLLGQFLLMILMAITTSLGLWLLGIPFPLSLGVFAGMMELLPYIGPWLSAIPAALIALLMGPGYLIMTLGLYLCLHVLEGYVLLPLINRQTIHMPPVLTLVSQLLLGELLGVLGLFAAAPLTVSLMVFLNMLYIEDVLGDESAKMPGEPGTPTAPEPRGAGFGPSASGTG